jgi:hypothetical protein
MSKHDFKDKWGYDKWEYRKYLIKTMELGNRFIFYV